MLGNSLSMTNRLQMGCALHAERRWLMTGTPTPGGPTSDIAHLQPLLAFLHNEPFGTEPVTWQVCRPVLIPIDCLDMISRGAYYMRRFML